jgi:hypothetical protein
VHMVMKKNVPVPVIMYYSQNVKIFPTPILIPVLGTKAKKGLNYEKLVVTGTGSRLDIKL